MINIIIVGKSGVGKTSLIKTYVDNSFDETNYTPTVGMTFSTKKIQKKSHSLKLQIWDTAGTEAFLKQINKAYINAFWKNIQGLVVVADINDSDSFEVASQWIEIIYEHVKLQNGKSVPFVFAINKFDSDLDLKLNETDRNNVSNFAAMDITQFDDSFPRYQTLVQKYDLKENIKVSAKTGFNVAQVFEQLLEKISKNQKNNVEDSNICESSSLSSMEQIYQQTSKIENSTKIRQSIQKRDEKSDKLKTTLKLSSQQKQQSPTTNSCCSFCAIV